MAAVALALSALVGLSGCVSWFERPTPASTSTPTDEKVDAPLASFYSQVLRWTSCGNGMQCTTATAPLDWTDPAADSIDLALVRQPATSGKAIGSLLVNPGGPGASGYDFVKDSVDFATSERLQRDYDIVGFDPRGVGRSSAVKCYRDSTQFDDYIYGISPGKAGSDEWIAATQKATTAFGEACAASTGPLLAHVDTVSAARDVDLLRAVLGDTKLNYLGYSYGTFLGATYAELYPGKTGHLVLDGALDPATSEFDVTKIQAEGFESAFRAYLKDCIGSKDCPFRGTVDNAMKQTRALLDSLDESPLAASDGRQLGSSTMFTAIIYPLYSPDTWNYLNVLFNEVLRGQTETAFALADAYYERGDDGTYSNNSTEAFIAINCLDYVNDADLDHMRQQAAEIVRDAPVFGPQMIFGAVGCSTWPYPGEGVRAPIHASGSSDIIVIGTTNDPATPYVWAQALAEELDNGHLITYKGEGHTAYNKSNSCVDDAVDDYFIDDKVPTSDPEC